MTLDVVYRNELVTFLPKIPKISIIGKGTASLLTAVHFLRFYDLYNCKLEIIYDPDTNDYTSAQTWSISATNSATEWQSWQSIQILKNEPQIATIRLTTHYDATNKDGRLVFDVTMKRGARHLEFVASQWQAQQLNIKAVTSLAGTNATGYVKATSADGQGNKYIIGTT